MNIEGTPGFNSQEPIIARNYKLYKLDGGIDSVHLEGPRSTFKETVANYAKLWCPTGFKIDHRSRTIEALEFIEERKIPEVEGTKMTIELIKKELLKYRSGTLVFQTTSGRAYGVRIIACGRKDKQMYKLMYDAERAEPDFKCSSSKMLKLDKVASSLRGLVYTEKTYYI